MLTVRKARQSDSDRFYAWRTDPFVVASSFSPGDIGQQDHRAWYDRNLLSDDCQLFVVLHDDVPAGQVRFDICGSEATINYSLGAGFRGKGLATRSLRLAMAAFVEEYDNVTSLVALVKPDNVASCRVFDKLEFEFDGVDGELKANRYYMHPVQKAAPAAGLLEAICLNLPPDARSIEIAGRRIGPAYPPYVIAELSANHNGKLETALKLVAAAAEAGADAVKIQTYRADTITMKSDKPQFQIKGGLWDGLTLYELYDAAHTPWEWHAALFEKARDSGITMFSSPFDDSAVDLLQNLDAPAFKIASFEVIDLPLIARVASCGKPVILSTGMANEDEIRAAVETARQAGCEDLVVMHCVSAYPAAAEDYNLRTLVDIGARHDVLTGLSDHTLENATAIAAIALGACVIEKHFTLDRDGGGPDDSFSLLPQELRDLCRDCRTAWESLGEVDYSRKRNEQANARFRRSLYVTADVKAGDLITPQNVRSIRPGNGLAPQFRDDLMGRRFLIDVERATPMSWELCDAAEKEET